MMNLATAVDNLIAKSVRLATFVCVCLLGVSAFSQEAPEVAKQAETKVGLPHFERQKSVFVSEKQELEKKKTRDPFFPNSVRRDPIPTGPTKAEQAAAAAAAKAKADAAAAAKTAAPPDPFNDLELKGVIGGRRPMATIYTRHKNYLFRSRKYDLVSLLLS